MKVVSFASIPLATIKVYVPLQYAISFDRYQWAWCPDKGDLYHDNMSFFEHTGLQPQYVSQNVIIYQDTKHELVTCVGDVDRISV